MRWGFRSVARGRDDGRATFPLEIALHHWVEQTSIPWLSSTTMNPLNLFWRRVLVAAAITLCFLRVGAAENSELGQSAGTVSVPAGVSKTEVRDAIVAALSDREWGIKEKTDDRVVGYLKHRSNEATVTLIYDQSKIDLFCVGYQIDKKTSAREKPEQPKGWLNNIKGDITKILNRTVSKK